MGNKSVLWVFTPSLRMTIFSYCWWAFRDVTGALWGCRRESSRRTGICGGCAGLASVTFNIPPAHMQEQEWCFDLLSVVSAVLSSWQAVVKQLLCPVGAAVGHRYSEAAVLLWLQKGESYEGGENTNSHHLIDFCGKKKPPSTADPQTQNHKNCFTRPQ